MYALVSWWQLPGNETADSVVALEPAIVPLAQQRPGFVEAFWTLERSNSKSVGFMLMHSIDEAHVLRDVIESHMEGQENPAVRLEMIRIQEIVAHVVPRSEMAKVDGLKAITTDVDSRG